MRQRWGLLCLVVLVSCNAPASGLTVDVRTDLIPDVDFASVQTEISSTAFTGPATTGNVINTRGNVRADYLAGQRAADLPGLAPGDWFVRVSLLDHAGLPVVRRVTTVRLVGHTSVTVVLARACTHVVCPQTGDDPAATECNGGRCVAPSCSPENPSACTGATLCMHDTDCSVSECGRGTCIQGGCLVTLDDSACRGRGGLCQLDGTCSIDPVDAGPLLTDTSCAAHETACTDHVDDDCDGQIDCADSDCGGVSCDDGNLCTHTDHCIGGVCNGTTISCVDEPCRSHTCNGTATCTDANIHDGMGCPDDGNPCTGDVCSGGTCTHGVVIGDNGQYDGMYYHRCCGGVPTQTGTDANCDSCGNNCQGQGCFTYLGVASCYCPVSNAFCGGLNRGNCYQGDYSGTPDGLGWLCQCQSDAECAPGATCCMGGAPGFRHFCFFGSC